jgi:type VI secretion system protein ImpA
MMWGIPVASADTIDFDRLLAPVSESNAVGENLRADSSPSSSYYLLKDARKAARAKERQSASSMEKKDRDSAMKDADVPDARAEWKPVLEQASLLLAERSKDLELVAWLIESLVRLYGFAGLRDGFLLAQKMIDQYWDSCYPEITEEGVEDRIAPLSGLNGVDAEGTLIVPIRNVSITQGQTVGPFATWHYTQAIALQQIADPAVREKRIQAGAVTLDLIDKAAMETMESGPAFFRTLLEDLQQCREVFDGLSRRLDELCGIQDAPPSSNIKNELSDCLKALQYVGKGAFETPEEESEAASDNAAETPGQADAAAVKLSSGYPKNREQAFKILLQLAEFFRRTEPHSPLSYTIEQVVRWGRMPLPDLLEEIIAEESARKNLFRLAGIRKSDEQA